MREIPEDVLNVARKYGEDIRFDIATISRLSASSLWAQTGVVERMNRGIARAIMAERERCAEIALKESQCYREHNLLHCALGAMQVAKAILSPAVLPAGDRAVGGGSSLPPTANGEGAQ